MALLSVHRADELTRVDDEYFTAEELERLDAEQDPAPVTLERQQQIVREMGEQMADLGKPAGVSYIRQYIAPTNVMLPATPRPAPSIASLR